MTFSEYIASRRVTDTPAGNFTTDARRDRNFPDAKSWDELRAYLERTVSIRMRDDVTAAARQVWNGYLAKVRKG